MNSRPPMARAAVAAGLLVACAAIAEPVLAESDDASTNVVAWFEDETLSLADGWGEAHACHSDDAGTRCYRSEDEMDLAEGLDAAPRAACGSSLKLYTGGSYGGDVLSLTQRLSLISLASYGFNNVTSSYKIGSCSAAFYDTTSGGTQYPGTTTAGTWASSMASSWDNRVGSVYIL